MTRPRSIDEIDHEHEREHGRLAHCRAHGCVATNNCVEHMEECDIEEYESLEEVEDE